jgi:hypothetical protein
MQHNGAGTFMSHSKERIKNSVILLQKRPQQSVKHQISPEFTLMFENLRTNGTEAFHRF